MTAVSAAAERNDRRAMLVAMQTRIADAVDDPETPPRDLAALTRRLMEIAKEIEAIDVQRGEEKKGIGAAVQTPDESFDGKV